MSAKLKGEMTMKHEIKIAMNDKYRMIEKSLRFADRLGFEKPYDYYAERLRDILGGMVTGLCYATNVNYDDWAEILSYSNLLVDRFRTRYPEK